MTRIATLTCAILATVFAADLAAQSLGTDVFASDLRFGKLYRVRPNKQVVGLGLTLPLGSLNMVTMDTDNLHVVVAGTFGTTTRTEKLIRVDPVAQRVVATIWSGAPIGSYQHWIDVDQDGDYLTCQSWYPPAPPPQLLRVKRDGSSVSTVFSPPSAVFLNAFCRDLTSGDWLLGDVSGPRLIRVDPKTFTAKGVIALGTVSLLGMAHDPQTPIVYVAGYTDATVLAVDTRNGKRKTLLSGMSSNAITTDRAPDGNGAVIRLGFGRNIFHIDRTGRVLSTTAMPWSLVSGVVFDRSRNLVTWLNKAPNDRTLRVSFPAQAGRRYAVAFGLSGYYPGVPLSDGRVIPLRPDALTLATAAGSLPPFITNNHGILGTRGDALVGLDFNRLSAPGLRVWAVAAVLDAAAPLGIAEISRPLVLVL